MESHECVCVGGPWGAPASGKELERHRHIQMGTCFPSTTNSLSSLFSETVTAEF